MNISTGIHGCIHKYIYIYIYTYTYACVYLFVYIYICSVFWDIFMYTSPAEAGERYLGPNASRPISRPQSPEQESVREVACTHGYICIQPSWSR